MPFPSFEEAQAQMKQIPQLPTLDELKQQLQQVTPGQWAKVAAGVGALGFFWYLTAPSSEQKAKASKKIDRDKMVEVYKQLSTEFHVLLVDLAFSIMRVRTKMKIQGLEDKVSAQDIAQVVISQWPTSKLDEIQKAVLAEHGLESVQELDYNASLLVESDDELKLYAEGLAEMQHTALAGKIPKMPGCRNTISKDNVLGVISTLNAAKISQFSVIMEDNPPSPDAIPDMLRQVSWEVEREVLDGYRKREEFDGHGEFYTALSDLMEDESFVRRKDLLDVAFQQKMQVILQASLMKTGHYPAKPEPKIVEVE